MQDSKNRQKIRHLGTIAQLCWAISLQLRHVSSEKKLVKQQCLPHICSQYGELAAEICWRVWGHPSIFQRVSRLGSVTARYSTSGRQAKFAALNRGRHLHSAGRPSRWALAHISSFIVHYSLSRLNTTLIIIVMGELLVHFVPCRTLPLHCIHVYVLFQLLSK